MASIAPIVVNKSSPDVSSLKQLLADYPVLVESADNACWAMLASANIQSFDSDTLLFQEGMECKHLMLIVEGSVRVYKNSVDGREVTLYRVEPGQLCINNLNNLVDGTSYPVVARTDSKMRGLVITKRAFHEALENSNSFRTYVLRNLTERLTHMANLVSGFAFDRLDLRVGCWLMAQFERNCSRAIEITHSELAHELGTTREMISRILKDFEHKRCIQLSRGRIHLVCKNTLHLISEGKGKVRKDFLNQ
jgi:CRP/FNR family transcriptional regulator, anaerobic regulatory protein